MMSVQRSKALYLKERGFVEVDLPGEDGAVVLMSAAGQVVEVTALGRVTWRQADWSMGVAA